jgi:tRNA pseudouridine13 synthase
MKKLPYLTEGLPGIGGRIKERVEDFCVDEIPLYEASGSGTHVYFRIRKVGIPTPAAVERIARHMGVGPGEIGLAGLKDAQAVSTQMLSIEHAEEAKLAAYHDSQLQVTWTSRHTNKLRPGHLAGNLFRIRVRGVGEEQAAAAKGILDVLLARGVPNFFGSQRFGARGDTAQLGEALVRGDLEEFIKLFLGRSRPEDPPECKAARDAFDTGLPDRAMQLWPRHYRDQRHAIIALKKTKRAGQAVAAIDKRMKRLFVSAFQSEIFNEVLARRLAAIDRVMAGDLAEKTDTGGIFTVEDEAVEQPRAQQFEISPTGPIVGYRCHLADGVPGEIEREALTAHQITLESLRRAGALKIKGARRPLRFRIFKPEIVAGCDDHGAFLELSFTAPAGCYATIVMRELTKAE